MTSADSASNKSSVFSALIRSSSAFCAFLCAVRLLLRLCFRFFFAFDGHVAVLRLVGVVAERLTVLSPSLSALPLSE